MDDLREQIARALSNAMVDATVSGWEWHLHLADAVLAVLPTYEQVGVWVWLRATSLGIPGHPERPGWWLVLARPRRVVELPDDDLAKG